MRAIVRDRYGAADVLRLEDIPTPTPADDELLVKVRAASINTADLDHLLGRPRIARLATGLGKPRSRAVGLDVAGEVVAVGANVRRFAPGEEVWADLFSGGSGAFAEYVCAPEAVFAPKPSGLTFEQAATVPHSGVLALQGLRGKGSIQGGDRVLVNGAGGCVGPFAIQLAKSFGAEVTGVDHTDKLEFMRSVGADHVIDYTQQDFTRNGERYDVILDIAANRGVLAHRRSLAPGGAYVLIARNLGGFVWAAVVGGLVSMAGSKRMGVFGWAPSKRDDLALLGQLIETGEIRPVIDRSYHLDQVAEAVGYLEAGKARGKLLIAM